MIIHDLELRILCNNVEEHFDSIPAIILMMMVANPDTIIVCPECALQEMGRLMS